MPEIILFNKPFNVLSQFSDQDNRQTLANFINIPNVYPAGRLDYDSEGLLILTADGQLQARISDPKHKLPKTYWVQVEGSISTDALRRLEQGVLLKDGLTKPAKAKIIPEPTIWERTPPIRYRQNDATSWIELTISEGKNRQVRRMTAEVGFPTLRLIRIQIGPWRVDDIDPGQYTRLNVHLPQTNHKKQTPKNRQQHLKSKRNQNRH